MHNNTIFGVSTELFMIITIFWIAVFIAFFGVDGLNDEAVFVLFIFLTFGTVLLIGSFGWQILIFPSLAIIFGAAIIAWKSSSN